LARRSGFILEQTRTKLALLRSGSSDPLSLVSLGARSPATRRTYRQAIRHFLETLEIWGRDLQEVDELDLLAYRELCQESGLAAATINKRFCAVRLLLRRLVQVGQLERNPASRLDGLTLQTSSFGAYPSLSVAQACQLLEACSADPTPRGARDRLAFRLGLRTGLRVSEILALRPEDIRQAEAYGVATIPAKGGADHQTKLSPSLMEEVNRFLELRGALGELRADAPLFAGILGPSKSASGAFALSPFWSYRAFSHALRKRGKGALIPFELTSHSLRATFITLALAAGAGLHRVQYAVGHQSPRTTERYDTERRSLEDHPTDYLESI
jgi:integrase/recombinase XerD